MTCAGNRVNTPVCGCPPGFYSKYNFKEHIMIQEHRLVQLVVFNVVHAQDLKIIV
jgi:hypothetical protein